MFGSEEGGDSQRAEYAKQHPDARRIKVMESQLKHRKIGHLLHKLRTRNLTAEEWRELTVLAGDDPFLQDALDGLNGLSAENRMKHIQSILYRLHSQNQKKVRPVLPVWIGVAASVLMIVVAVLVIGRFTWNSSIQSVQVHPASTDESELVAADHGQNPTTSSANTSEDKEFREEESAALKSTPASQDKHLLPSTTGNADRSPAPNANRLYSKDIAELSDEQDVSASGPTTRPVPKSEETTENIETQSADFRIDAGDHLSPEVKGMVLNHLGEPLPNAQVQLKGTGLSTQTDYLGNFSLDIPGSGRDNALVISPVGYLPVETLAKDGDSLIVRMFENTDRGAPEVTKLAQKKSSQSYQPPGRALATPAAGERHYQKYIRQNRRYPAQASNSGIHGTVILEFDLSPDGTPTAFRVLQSLGFGCDEEAIRLIREGPKWNVGTGGVNTGRRSIDF